VHDAPVPNYLTEFIRLSSAEFSGLNLHVVRDWFQRNGNHFLPLSARLYILLNISIVESHALARDREGQGRPWSVVLILQPFAN
jgi:hypothetical protein